MIRELATRINCAPEPDTISSFISRGARVDEIQVTMDERIAGTSYLNISRSIGYMLRVGVSILLLQLSLIHISPFSPSATPAGITHYTLQAKSCSKGGTPLETPDNKTGGMLPSPGAYRRLLSAVRFSVCFRPL